MKVISLKREKLRKCHEPFEQKPLWYSPSSLFYFSERSVIIKSKRVIGLCMSSMHDIILGLSYSQAIKMLRGLNRSCLSYWQSDSFILMAALFNDRHNKICIVESGFHKTSKGNENCLEKRKV